MLFKGKFNGIAVVTFHSECGDIDLAYISVTGHVLTNKLLDTNSR